MNHVVNLQDVSLKDIAIVGGKNASSGEMIQHLTKLGIKVPAGFATTVEAYKTFLSQNQLNTKIDKLLKSINYNNVNALHQVSKKIRHLIITTPFFPEFEHEIAINCAIFKNISVAVRSSATLEDSDDVSFAGAQETFLNVRGLNNILHAIKLVFASLYNSRAIAYRYDHALDHSKCSLSVGIQPMIRSDKSVSGVTFTIDTESGFDRVILISASYGLGETIVQGQVNPDEFLVYKPALGEKKFAILQRKLGEKTVKMVFHHNKNLKSSIKKIPVPHKDQLRFCLDDKDIHILAEQALLIEKYYGKPMDIEWAKDGITDEIYIVQARPETVSHQTQSKQILEHYILSKKYIEKKILVTGQSIGQRIGAGNARIILDPKKMDAVKAGDVLVTDMTDPDWEPVMKLASAIVTNRGGRTCHAAIIARELGIPAVVGCGHATSIIKNQQSITVSCAEGQIGYVYAGKLAYERKQISIHHLPKLPVKLCMNMGNPEKAFSSQFLPNEGVGLARLEFIISNIIGVHPNAVLSISKLPKPLQQEIVKRTTAYKNPVEFYIEKLREGISMIAAAFSPKEVIFRFSDFKSNEYANLLGGSFFEPQEENPMIGFRGAARYCDNRFKQCFELECKAFKRVREQMGLVNAQVMIPFVRTVQELEQVIELMESYGLKRGEEGLKIYMMCEIPSNVLLANEFLKHVDGFSIGSNDLTQLTLGLDRDSNILSGSFDERNEAIKKFLHTAITACKKQHKYIGICGQAPSDYPDFAHWLMQEGIECISLNPDSIVETWLSLGEENNASTPSHSTTKK